MIPRTGGSAVTQGLPSTGRGHALRSDRQPVVRPSQEPYSATVASWRRHWPVGLSRCDCCRLVAQIIRSRQVCTPSLCQPLHHRVRRRCSVSRIFHSKGSDPEVLERLDLPARLQGPWQISEPVAVVEGRAAHGPSDLPALVSPPTMTMTGASSKC